MKAWVILPLLLIPLGIVAYFGLSGAAGVDPETLPQVAVKRGPFQITLTVTGELEAVNSVVVTAPSAGGSKKITFLVDEGARVEKGEVVVKFDDTDFRKDLKDAQNDLKTVETRVEQQLSSAEQALAELDNQIAMAELSVERAELTLTDSDTVARIEQERARITVKEAGLTLAKLARNRELKEQDLQSALTLLELEKEKVMGRLIRTQEALESCAVTAPTSGLVILAKVWNGSGWGPVSEGDTVWPGRNVLDLPDLSELQAVAQVHEVDVGQVELGQKATLSLDAFPGPSFTGEVKSIASLAATVDRGSKVKYFRTLLTVENPADTMKPGMTTKIDIHVKTLEGVISIPREGVFKGPEGEFVYLLEGRSFEAHPVVTGPSNNTHTVIESGLEEGQVVSLVDVKGEPGEAKAKESKDEAPEAGEEG